MTTGYLVQTLLSLLILSGIMWGVLSFTKKLRLQKFTGELKVIDRLPLNATTSVVLVDFRDHQYLMGVGGQHVEILEKL